MDPLSQVIALMKPEAMAWQAIEAHDSWSIRFPAADFAVFGQIIAGSCFANLGDGLTRALETGDFLLIRAPSTWTLASSAGGSPINFKEAIADPALLLSTTRDPSITRFIAGAFHFAAPNTELLSDLMPGVVHVRGADIAAGRLGSLLAILGEEALAGRPGRSLILDRLLEIMLVEALRHDPAGLDRTRKGLLTGLADIRVGASLRLMHEDSRRGWTVAELARHVGMSRSAFSARFTNVVGSPPINYLANWRMCLAKSALRSSKRPMTEIAELAGFQSVSAFSTAFRRATGWPPTRYAHSAEEPGRLTGAGERSR